LTLSTDWPNYPATQTLGANPRAHQAISFIATFQRTSALSSPGRPGEATERERERVREREGERQRERERERERQRDREREREREREIKRKREDRERERERAMDQRNPHLWSLLRVLLFHALLLTT